jgi:polysaccharide export outer membrane protein
MILYKPIVASVVASLMIAGLAAAQDPSKRPSAPAASAPAASAPAAAPPAAAAPAPGVAVGPEYKIGIDDVLDIAVWNNTTVSRTVPVRPDGKITLPLINEVQAAGLTPTQLRAALMAKLVEYMPTPELSVIVREVHSNKISVLGEVRKAGRYEITQRATVLDAVALAGGFNDWARRSKLVIMRHEASGVKRIPVNYNRIVAEEDENVILQPGDIVVVP